MLDAMRTLTLALLAGVLLVVCSTVDPLPGYVRAASDVEASVRSAIEEYYDLRGRAAVTGDIAPLYSRHRGLAVGEDRTKGVNVEAFFVERIQSFNRETSGPRVTEMRFDATAYGPLRVYVMGETAVAFVHGIEEWHDVGTKAEMRVRFDLRRESERWTIERTDEQLLGERPPATPAR